MEVMNAKQTLKCSIFASMPAPQEKHNWCFHFLTSFPWTYGRWELTRFIPSQRWETECNGDEHRPKQATDFKRSCCKRCKAGSGNAAVSSLPPRVPRLRLGQQDGEREGLAAPSYAPHRPPPASPGGEITSALPCPKHRRGCHRRAPPKEANKRNGQHVVPRKYDKEPEAALE